MLVKIEEIQGGGLALTEKLNPKVLVDALSVVEGARLIEAGKLAADFARISGTVRVQGKFAVKVSLPCRRCLGDNQQLIAVEFSLRMVNKGAHGSVPGKRSGSEHAGEMDLDEVDAEPYDGKTIDLDPVVREQLLLALPVTALCKEACKGLCATCGSDLNVSDCGHRNEESVDGRWLALVERRAKANN